MAQLPTELFIPVDVLHLLFRRLFFDWLQAGYAAGLLRDPGSPEHALAYLGRYTHRVAIANSRWVSANETSVTIRWRDYRHGNALRLMSLEAHEFINRFFAPYLAGGFHRISQYGFYANGRRCARLATIRQLLASTMSYQNATDGNAAGLLPNFERMSIVVSIRQDAMRRYAASLSSCPKRLRITPNQP